jgi:GxxExxY protein
MKGAAPKEIGAAFFLLPAFVVRNRRASLAAESAESAECHGGSRMTPRLLHGEVTEQILGVFFQVHCELGAGFLESVYARSMGFALKDAGLRVDAEVPVAVHFRGRRVGAFRADMVVESVVLREFKAGAQLDPNASAQTINYLRATALEVALILHFGARATFKRVVATNNHKLLPRTSADSADSVAPDNAAQR